MSAGNAMFTFTNYADAFMTTRFFITLDRADALTGKNTIFGTVRGDTYFNVMAIAEGELQPGTEKPVYPIIIKTIEINDNSMPEQTVPRITAEEKRQQEKARRDARKAAASRSRKKEGVKNKSLMSFEDEEESAAPSTSALKLKSAHELLNDPHLSQEVRDDRGTSDRLRRIQEEEGSRTSRRDKQESSRNSKGERNSIPASIDSAAFSTRIERRSSSPEVSRKKKGKDSVEPQGENDRVKAEIAKVQADLKKFTRQGSSDGEDGENDKGEGKQKSKSSGAALLAAERAKYAQGGRSIGKGSTGAATKGKRRREEDDDIMDMLNGFRSKIRAAAPEEPTRSQSQGGGDEEGVDGYAGEILEGDDDDTGWMSHTLQFRKDATMDQHNIDEYEVVDPRDKNMTLEDAKRQEARLKRMSEQSGRLKAGASAKAERSIRSREDGGGRNFGRERY